MRTVRSAIQSFVGFPEKYLHHEGIISPPRKLRRCLGLAVFRVIFDNGFPLKSLSHFKATLHVLERRNVLEFGLCFRDRYLNLSNFNGGLVATLLEKRHIVFYITVLVQGQGIWG